LTKNLKTNVDGMLIYCRGIGSREMKDMFLYEKIDKIISKYYTRYFNKVSNEEISEISSQNKIERISLPTEFVDLTKESTIKEPTYKEIYVIYRNLGDSNCAEVEICSFVDIPMADLELTFPENETSLRPSDVAKSLISIIISLIVLTFNVLFKGGWTSRLMAIFGFLLSLNSIYSSLKNIKTNLLSLVIEILSHRT
jgi:hypothetical protein